MAELHSVEESAAQLEDLQQQALWLLSKGVRGRRNIRSDEGPGRYASLRAQLTRLEGDYGDVSRARQEAADGGGADRVPLRDLPKAVELRIRASSGYGRTRL